MPLANSRLGVPMWERDSFSRQTAQETLQHVLKLLIISMPSKSSRLSCPFRLAWPSQFSVFGRFLRERDKISMSCKGLNQGTEYAYQIRGLLDAEGKKLGGALWFQKSVAYLPEPARNQAYPKRNQSGFSKATWLPLQLCLGKIPSCGGLGGISVCFAAVRDYFHWA